MASPLLMDDTIAALASAPGPAVRGIVRVSGPSVKGVVSSVFTPDDFPRWKAARLPWRHPGTIDLPNVHLPLPVDVLLWPTGRSYTGQPTAELHSIGSPPLLEAVLQNLFAHGARPAQRGEFTLRAFLAGRIDLVQAEAVLGVIDATDQQQLRLALDQLGGGLSHRVAALHEELLLHLADLGCGEECEQQAEAAVRAYGGSGFGFAYETHMTAAAALAAAELADRTGDDAWLDSAYGPIANLMRLSWLHEVDYGPAAEARTFFGLAPTQQAAAITPKEQYETWIYLTEFLRLSHGRVDPDVEKLVAEFSYHTLITLASSLPPLLPPGVATEFPSAYPTVSANRLDLYIPLEDLRDGRETWGVIGQEVYGAGMAPTFAALAYVSPVPGVTIYSGYPHAEMSEDGGAIRVVWTGASGYLTPVVAWGVTRVILDGEMIPTERCGDAVCFEIGRAHV